MRGLAERVMRGRAQAIAVAVVAAAIPMLFWVSASVVGLITLRHGVREGTVVLLWALLPAAVAAWLGEFMPAAVLVGAVLLGGVLRTTLSWPWTLCGAALLGLLFSAGLYTLGSGYLDLMAKEAERIFAEVLVPMLKQSADASGVVLQAPGASDIAGTMGLYVAVGSSLCMMIARWWQAALYNPGGFRVEMHALRLAPVQMLGLMTTALLLVALGEGFRWWAWMPLVPLLFAGLGLTHALLASRGKSGFVVLFYLALLLLPPVKQLVVVLAAIDGWLDIRRRWMQPPGG